MGSLEEREENSGGNPMEIKNAWKREWKYSGGKEKKKGWACSDICRIKKENE